MVVTNEFVEQYDHLIRYILLKEFRVRKKDLDEYVNLVYERLLSTDSYDPNKSAFTTWLKWSVIRSVVSNGRRKAARSKDALDHAVDIEAAANVIGREDAGTDQDELDRIFRASHLSPRDKDIMRMIHLNGLTYEETADMYGMSIDAVEKVAYRAMAALRRAAG